MTDLALAVLIVVLWIVCSVLTYGHLLAHFQRKFNVLGIARASRKNDLAFAIAGGFLGPFGLISTLLCGFTDYGFMWRPLRDDEINDDF